MAESDSQKELAVFQQVVSALATFDRDVQLRLLQAVATFLQLPVIRAGPNPGPFRTGPAVPLSTDRAEAPAAPFSDRAEMSAKEFLMEKQPRTDIERVTCLAYYLTHIRDTPRFKTLDVSKLNTEAAQPKFTNASSAVRNATTAGYLVTAARAQKQLSAMGEQFVHALPDRQAARDVLARMRPRRKKKRRTRRPQTAKATAGAGQQ